MKKLVLSIFVAGAIAFGLQSCEEADPCEDVTCAAGEICDDGNCVTDPNACSECGTYDGTVSNASGDTLTIPGIIDTVLVDFPATATVAETAVAGELNLTVSLTLNGIPINPSVNGTLSGSTLTVTDETFNYNGINILINGDMTFDGMGGTTGNLSLSEGAQPTIPGISANLVFEGTKQ